MKKIIIDTDIGDDIDDAFALALACMAESIEVKAVTTVYRNTAQRAQLAATLIKACGKSIPVYEGERLPLNGKIRMFGFDCDGAPENSRLCQWDESYADAKCERGAVDYIISAVENGEVDCILTLGAMTNVARACIKAPHIADKLNVVCMGGYYSESKAEWNVLCDPEAYDTVIRSGANIKAVGLDVTLKCELPKGLIDEFKSRQDERSILLSLWLSRWFKSFEFAKSVMHDPLALVTIMDDKVCGFESKYVRIDLKDIVGRTVVSDVIRDGFNPIEVATKVDVDRFYGIFRKYLLN